MNVVFRSNPAEMRALAVAPAPVRVARVEAFNSFEAASAVWQHLESTGALMTPYQRYAWSHLWHRHVSSGQGAEPLIIAAYDEAYAPLFVLPLECCHQLGLKVASFFGGRHANLNSAIWRRDVAARITTEDLLGVLSFAAQRNGIDVYRFVVQPARIAGFENPLALLPHQPGPDDVQVARFEGLAGQDALAACLSGSMRKRLRAKERKLQEFPEFRAFEATSTIEVERVLTAFLKQKAEHLASQGISNEFEDDGIIDFLRAASNEGLQNGHPVIELRALEAEGEIIAVFGGVTNGQRMSCMFISYTTGPARQWSPGLVLLAKMIVHYADRGIGSLDLGAGRAHYKTFFCKDTEQVFDTIIGMTPRGRLAAMGLRQFRQIKGHLKSRAPLWSTIKAVRKLLGRYDRGE